MASHHGDKMTTQALWHHRWAIAPPPHGENHFHFNLGGALGKIGAADSIIGASHNSISRTIRNWETFQPPRRVSFHKMDAIYSYATHILPFSSSIPLGCLHTLIKAVNQTAFGRGERGELHFCLLGKFVGISFLSYNNLAFYQLIGIILLPLTPS